MEIVEKGPKRLVPANVERALFSKQDFIAAHLKSKGAMGPEGHGFTKENLKNNTAYYTFKIAPKIMGIMLNTVNEYGGQIGSIPKKTGCLDGATN